MIKYINYEGKSKDLVFYFGRYRQFSFRWYDRDRCGSFIHGFGLRSLSITPKYKRFAIDLHRLSLVFENYRPD